MVKNGQDTIISSKSIKALGIFITPTMSWDLQVDRALQKSSHIIKRLRFLGKWLNKEELLSQSQSLFIDASA
jgi:hypothetical protein